jgi:hypothetical protein
MGARLNLQHKENAMLRITKIGMLALAGLVGFSASAPAQVFVRAPFVRVWVGGPGVGVRAPFVNLWVPGGPPPFVVVPPVVAPPVVAPNGPPPVIAPQDQPPPVKGPAPRTLDPDETPPPPTPMAKNPLTLESFARSFQARPGSYEVTLINPVTKAATPVRFTLPEGAPRRVVVRGDEVEFHYGVRHFVRIEFDEHGAIVISR